MSKIIFLIGFMGCGKSTLGPAIAKELGFNFIDLDEQIEQDAKQSIASLFETHGEKYFRQLEAKTLNELSTLKECIIATGGGTPCYFDNLKKMKEKGLTIYLKTDASELATRLQSAKSNRPLIAYMNHEELVSFVKEKLSEREAIYQQADLIINSSTTTAKEIAKKAMNYFCTKN